MVVLRVRFRYVCTNLTCTIKVLYSMINFNDDDLTFDTE